MATKKTLSKKSVLGVIKSGKYLKGWGYSTLNGKKFSWTKNKKEAHKFDSMHSDADHYAGITKGRVIIL